MDIEILENEAKRLIEDKEKIEMTIVNLQNELNKLKSQNDMLTGAIQTCNYLISQSKSDEVDEEQSE